MTSVSSDAMICHCNIERWTSSYLIKSAKCWQFSIAVILLVLSCEYGTRSVYF